MKKIKNIQWLYKHHIVAFAALPECYQADNCLIFYWENNRLYAEPKADQGQALGEWRANYNPTTDSWN